MLVPPATDDSDSDDDETTHVECSHCGYEWEYSGEMWTATCPRCNRKTETGLKPDDFED